MMWLFNFVHDIGFTPDNHAT